MKSNAQHVDSKPRETRDDIAENGHHHQAALNREGRMRNIYNSAMRDPRLVLADLAGRNETFETVTTL